MNSKHDAENTPRFRPEHAFVVQFSGLAANGGFEAGRVEHLASGRSQIFEDERTLISFMAVTLASVETRTEGE